MLATLSLLLVTAFITYSFVIHTLVPTLFPLVDDQVLVFTDATNITVVRLAPLTKEVIVAQRQVTGAESTTSFPLSWQLGLPIDYSLEAPTERGIDDALLPARVEEVFWQLMRQHQTQNLSLRQTLQWWGFVHSVPDAKISTQNATTPASWQQLKNRLQLDRSFTQCQIAISNTTGVAGLGSLLSRILEEGGFTVIKVVDSQEALTETVLSYDPINTSCARQLDRVQNLADVNGVRIEDTSASAIYRAPIVIKIGTDLSSQLKTWAELQKKQ